ncbi:hypothetical protein LTR15_001524 [Elasticomyces elasticus]|nr:hypothetical protein LTR15_001524 [Elasticomyces elasticus]
MGPTRLYLTNPRLALSFSSLALILISIPIAYVVGVVVYRIWFHPLSKYPGPKIAAATRFWWARQQLGGRFPLLVHDLHVKHGEIVRIAPNELSFSGAAAWKDIYGFRNGLPENRKDPGENTDADHRHPTIINADRQTHGELRKLLSNAFSDKTLKGQEPVLLHYVDLLIERLKEEAAKEPVMDLVRWYNYVTFDIIGHLAFNEPFDCLKNTEYVILRIMPKKMVERRRWHYSLVAEKVKRRKTREPDYVDFMSHLLKAEEAGRLQMPDLVANANLMVIAGSETTATILSGTTYFLLTHPEVMKKLVHEIRTSFTSADQINISEVSKLKYINGVLDESFRLYPPAAGSHPRLTPPEGANIVGEWLPGNVSLGMAQYAVFRSPTNFADPEQFIPERWFSDDPKFANDKREALQPFSFGPRNCIGRNLANIEMRLIFAKMIWWFDLELMPEAKNWVEQQYIYTTWEKVPLKGASWMNGHAHLIPDERSGIPMNDWINDIPNNGLIRYRVKRNRERVFITSPKGLAEVLVQKNYDFAKPYSLRLGLGRILGIGLIIAEGDEHKKQRRQLMPAFAHRHIKDLYPIFWSKSVELANALSSTIAVNDCDKWRNADIVQIAQWLPRATLDIIGTAALGQDFNAIKNPDNEVCNAYAHVFDQPAPSKSRMLKLLAQELIASVLPIQRTDSITVASESLKQVARRLIHDKQLSRFNLGKSTDKDILSVALESGTFSEEQLVHQTMTFLAAGHETTATSMTWAILALCQYPDVQKKLREEVRAKLPSPDGPQSALVTAELIVGLPYLHAVCSEVLRVHPPAGMTKRVAVKDTSILNQHIPAGTDIVIIMRAINQSKDLWGEDAKEFKPDRWLGEGKNNGGASNNYAYMTFLHGELPVCEPNDPSLIRMNV